jgi:adenylate cyclase
VSTGDVHTFLFTDLVGYTALADSEGDERAAQVAVEFAALIGELLPQYGATLVKALGDGLMIRCDEPADGIRLGLRIVGAVDATAGFPPVRVGVHTGSAVHRDGDWYGRGVNVAARLCAAAGGGQLLVSERTREAARGIRRLDVGERKLHWLKNVTEPIAAATITEAARGRLRGACGHGPAKLGLLRGALR